MEDFTTVLDEYRQTYKLADDRTIIILQAIEIARLRELLARNEQERRAYEHATR